MVHCLFPWHALHALFSSLVVFCVSPFSPTSYHLVIGRLLLNTQIFFFNLKCAYTILTFKLSMLQCPTDIAHNSLITQVCTNVYLGMKCS